MLSYDVILHPTDFTEESDQAFRLACNMARDEFSSLVVVHALPPEYKQGCKPESELNDDHSSIVENCREHFKQMRAKAPDIPITFRIAFGHAVGAILNIACEVNAEIIVIASHRHSQFHLQLHGSIAEGLLRQSHCPVVVLRQPQNSLNYRPSTPVTASS